MKISKSSFLSFCLIIASIFTTNKSFAKEEVSTMNQQTAIFAMGCFWCAESEFRDSNNQPIHGIISIKVGYAGGTTPNPTYQSHAGYKEAVKITFDPNLISYKSLLNIFWQNIDPLNSQGQFCDNGSPYTSAIFYSNEEQQKQALKNKDDIKVKLGNQTIATEITANTKFYDAEEYHQNYKAKNPVKYKYYRWRCGRDQRLQELWGKKSSNE